MTIALGIACVLVLLETAVLLLHVARLRRLGRVSLPEPSAWPRVSVVMAARDEARDVADAVSSRLGDDYPDLELILVDDRSTDGTGRLGQEAARGDPRFAVVRVDELPAGWLGKVHAMNAGLQRATGEWVLFSDGDVSVKPGTLRKAIAYCQAGKVDLLALIPEFKTGSLLMDAVWVVFLRGMLVFIDPRAVRDPRSKVAMGSGAFNLVRRAALERTPGLSHLRLETGDDVALGMMVKRAGGLVEIVDGSDLASVPMYRSVGQFFRGVEKNGSTTAMFPFPLLVLAFVALWTFVFSPLVAIAVGPTWLRVLGAIAVTAYTGGEVVTLWSNRRRWFPALLWPIGGLIMSWGVLRSTWLAKRNGGVRWRETYYSLEELKAGRRLSL